MFAILTGTLAGVALGVVSGLIPGIHANTMAGVLLAMQGVLLTALGPVAVGASLFAALVTHTFLDIVPSTFFGVPDADTAITVLPAHALCLEGKGEEAVRVSAIGSACAVVEVMPLFLLFFLVLPLIQPLIDWGIGILLIIVAGLLIVYSDSPEWAFAVFGVSGLLGLFTFNYSFLAWHTLGDSSILMPLLTGLFGISVLITSSEGEMPAQTFSGLSVNRTSLIRHSASGTIAGAVVGWLPGLSNATANALLSFGIDYGRDRDGYIIATSAANTANAFLGLAALYALSRMRNGVMAALGSMELPDVTTLLIAGVAASIVAYLLTIRLAGFAGFFTGLKIRKLSYIVVVFIVLLTFILSGPFGLAILVLATCVGLVPQIVNIRRVFCMGAVMVPVICMSFSIVLL